MNCREEGVVSVLEFFSNQFASMLRGINTCNVQRPTYQIENMNTLHSFPVRLQHSLSFGFILLFLAYHRNNYEGYQADDTENNSDSEHSSPAQKQ